MSPPQDIGDQALLGAAQPEADLYGLNDTLATGGYTGSASLATTEIWTNGVWASSHNMLTTRHIHASGGDKSGGMVCGGDVDGSSSPGTACEALIDGVWTEDEDLPERRYYTSGGGSRTNFLIAQGNNGATERETSLEFDGTTWNNSADMHWNCYASYSGS